MTFNQLLRNILFFQGEYNAMKRGRYGKRLANRMFYKGFGKLRIR